MVAGAKSERRRRTARGLQAGRACANTRNLRISVMASLLLLLPGIGGGAFSCGECLTLQEGIQKSIVHNISDLEAKAQVGSANTATVEIGQIIWSVCDLSLIHI